MGVTRARIIGAVSIVCVVCVGVGACVLVPRYHRDRGPSASLPFQSRADAQQIERVIARAEAAKDTLFIAPNPVGGAPLAAAGIQAAADRASTVLGMLYGPGSKLLALRVQQARNGLTAQASGGARVIAGGIRDLIFDAISITGNVATAHLTFTNYAEYADRQPDGSIIYSHPSNGVIATVTLVKTNRGWRITDDSWRFAPGTEP